MKLSAQYCRIPTSAHPKGANDGEDTQIMFIKKLEEGFVLYVPTKKYLLARHLVRSFFFFIPPYPYSRLLQSTDNNYYQLMFGNILILDTFF